MTPILIGYFPKRTRKRPDWLEAAGVEEICSVSECVSEGPDDWIQRWLHNNLGVYNSPELAWRVVPEESRYEFDLYAYQMFPVKFVEGRQEPVDIPPLEIQALDGSFERLGYDIVSNSVGSGFECSPLSCNLMAKEVRVNSFCLVDECETAFQLAIKFEAGGCEPGPYHVVEVWRQRSRTAQRS
jgi:hypothetical protein